MTEETKEEFSEWVVKPEVSQTFVKTTKGVYPLPTLQKAEKKEPKSKQIKEPEYLAQHDLVPLPFEASSLLKLKDNCPYFDACVKQIAKDVVGQGWMIALREGKKENKKEKEKIEAFIAESGGDRDETFEQTIERAIIDWGLIGWWGWEVSRDESSKEVNGFWHVPAQTIRVHTSHDKYCQIRGQNKVWFKRFGLEENIDIKSGEKREEGNKANELIFYRNYYPQSDYYGAPNILSSVGSVYGLIGIRDYNLSFFENYGIPTALIILRGRWKKTSAKQISDFLNVEIKGSDNAHKTMLIHPHKDSEIEIKELGVNVKEGAFNLYNKNLRDDVLVVYKMPPYRIGIAEVGKLGGTTAPESTRIYAHSVIKPLEKTVEYLITEKLIKEGLNCESYRFELNELDLRDEDAEIKKYKELFAMGAMTPNQIIERLNLGETYEAGNQYYVSSAFLPVGEEAVEKRERALFFELEELKAKVNEALEKEK